MGGISYVYKWKHQKAQYFMVGKRYNELFARNKENIESF